MKLTFQLALVVVVAAPQGWAQASQDNVAQQRQDYEAKARAGDANAQLALGLLAQAGTTDEAGRVRPDYAAAARWYQQASDQGLVLATYYLANLHEDGLGVPKDEAVAARLFKKGAESGHSESMVRLAEIWMTGSEAEKRMGFDWLKKAESLGNTRTFNALGVAFQTGRGVFHNFAVAAQYYRKGADAGDCVATMNLGGMYYNGDGVSQDRNEAVRWFYKALECQGPKFEGMDQKAATFIQKATQGRLPRPIEIHRPDSPSVQDAAVIAFVIAVAALVATSGESSGASSSSYPNQSDRDLKRFQLEHARSLCRHYGNSLACGAALYPY
jgi:hypothetical protein